MVKDNLFVFNGVASSDFGLIVSGYGTYAEPARDVTMLSVAGHDGDLTLDNGRFTNVDITYKALIYKDFDENFKNFTSFMYNQKGYKRLEDNLHPNEYRLGVFKSAIKPNIKGDYVAGSFEVTFNCKPQRFLKSGEEIIDLTDGGGLYNETQFAAKPLIRAYAAGNLTVNGKTLTISAVDGYIDLDCEMLNAYKGTTNLNANVSGEFPTLVAGNNTIVYTGKLEIKPRWFIV